jgi:DNA transformation protein
MKSADESKTGVSQLTAERLEASLSKLGAIRVRKMFGGYGVFEEDTMFALIDKDGGVYFKADDTNLHKFTTAGSNKHSRMPYYKLPDAVLANEDDLLDWAQSSIAASKKAK